LSFIGFGTTKTTLYNSDKKTELLNVTTQNVLLSEFVKIA